MAFLNGGYLNLRVWCKEDAGAADGFLARYGVAVTIAAGIDLPSIKKFSKHLLVRARV